jgi:hypothetical protein
MQNIENRGSIAVIINSTKTAGQDLPKALTDDLDKIDRAAQAVPWSDPSELVRLYAEAARDGRDPLEDKKVLEALRQRQVAQAVGQWPEALAGWAEGARIEVWASRAKQLMSQWSTAVGDSGAALTDAASHLNMSVPLAEQVTAALQAGGERAEAWRKASQAVMVIDSLLDAQTALIRLLRMAPLPRNAKTILAAPGLPPRDLADLDDRLDAWELAGRGIAITGADLDEYRGSLEAIEQHRAEVQASRARRNRLVLGGRL